MRQELSYKKSKLILQSETQSQRPLYLAQLAHIHSSSETVRQPKALCPDDFIFVLLLELVSAAFILS